MTSLSSQNKSAVLKHDIVEASLEKLVGEANALFQVLDSASTKIRNLEKKLSELKAHFPFRYFLREDKSSAISDLAEHHQKRTRAFSYEDSEMRCRASTCWYLAWEADENSKNFRLYLMSIQKEIIIWAPHGDVVREIEPWESEVLFRKPLIETDLSTRLQFAEYLFAFISNFQDYLRRYRISIQSGNLAPFEEEIPF